MNTSSSRVSSGGAAAFRANALADLGVGEETVSIPALVNQLDQISPRPLFRRRLEVQQTTPQMRQSCR